MKLALPLALTLAAGVAAPAYATTASTSASAEVGAPTGGIQVLSQIVLPTVTSTNVSGGGFSGSRGGSGHVTGAALTIRTQGGDTLSMSVPQTFQVVRSGGTEGLTVKTTTDTDLQLAEGGVVLGGSEVAGGTLSVNVGGLVDLASNGVVAPGPYEGTLVVLVQYN